MAGVKPQVQVAEDPFRCRSAQRPIRIEVFWHYEALVEVLKQPFFEYNLVRFDLASSIQIALPRALKAAEYMHGFVRVLFSGCEVDNLFGGDRRVSHPL